MKAADAQPEPVTLKKRLARGGIAAALLLVIAGIVGYVGRTELKEMEKHTGRVRATTSVFGIAWSSPPQDSEITGLLPPLARENEEWTAIAGGSWGSRINFRWGGIAMALLNAVEWMESERIPAADRRRFAQGLLEIARRDDALYLGFQEDRIVVTDPLKGTLLECIRPAR